MWNKCRSLPSVQPGDLRIRRDKLCVCMCECVGGSWGVTCNHKTPQMETHVGGPERNLPSSLCCIHAIFGASGAFIRPVQPNFQHVVYSQRTVHDKAFPESLGCLFLLCSDRLFATMLKHPSCRHSQSCVINQGQIFRLEFLRLQLALGASWSTSTPTRHLQQTSIKQGPMGREQK